MSTWGNQGLIIKFCGRVLLPRLSAFQMNFCLNFETTLNIDSILYSGKPHATLPKLM